MSISVKYDAKKAIKRFNDIKKRADNPKIAMNIISTEAHKNVLQHFRDEEGKTGSWKRWSKGYAAQRAAGRGGSKVLHDTGLLRGSIKNKAIKDEAYVFTKTHYAKHHQYGTKHLPVRDFMWLHKKVITKLGEIYMHYVSRGKR